MVSFDVHMCIGLSTSHSELPNQPNRWTDSHGYASCSVCLRFRKTFTLYDIEIFVFRIMQFTFRSHYYLTVIHVRIRMTCNGTGSSSTAATVAPTLFLCRDIPRQSLETCTKRNIISQKRFGFPISLLRRRCKSQHCRRRCKSQRLSLPFFSVSEIL